MRCLKACAASNAGGITQAMSAAKAFSVAKAISAAKAYTAALATESATDSATGVVSALQILPPLLLRPHLVQQGGHALRRVLPVTYYASCSSHQASHPLSPPPPIHTHPSPGPAGQARASPHPPTRPTPWHLRRSHARVAGNSGSGEGSRSSALDLQPWAAHARWTACVVVPYFITQPARGRAPLKQLCPAAWLAG